MGLVVKTTAGVAYAVLAIFYGTFIVRAIMFLWQGLTG
jgi:hypothetical protein